MPKPNQKKKVIIAGAGLAGCAAAAILAEKGISVVILEKENYLGGRAGAWTEKLSTGESIEMERGFHAFFKQYYNLRNFLKRIDPELSNLLPLEDYPVFGPDGYKETFSKLPARPPFNVIELVRRTPTLKFKDLFKINISTALKMLQFDLIRTYQESDNMNAKNYLDSLNFPPQARKMLFNVFSHSFFNPEAKMSAAEMLMMFHFYFMGNNEGLIFDVMKKPFSKSIWYPVEKYLRKLNVEIKTNVEIEKIRKLSDQEWVVYQKGNKQKFSGQAVVLAVNVPALQKIIQKSNGLNNIEWENKIKATSVTLPFAVWRIWFDKPAKQGRYPFIGTAGLGIIDNISVFELMEDESQKWVDKHKGSVIEIHAYAVPKGYTEKSIKKELLTRLFELYPEFNGAKILEQRYIWKQDCPAFPPGFHKHQPSVQTPFEGLVLAGDFVKMDIPCALMEKAVSSGYEAANILLQMWGIKGIDIKNIPKKGLLNWLNFFRFSAKV